MKFLNNLLPRRSLRPVLTLIIFHFLCYTGPKLLTLGRVHADWTTAADRTIPFLSWTVLIYVGAYVYWAVNVILAARAEDKRAIHFFAADLMTKLITGAIFLLLPTTNVRPELGSGIWDRLLWVIYVADTPDNLFPSMHCSFSWTCFRAVDGDERIPRWYRIFSFCFTLMIFASTVTTRQHVLADVIGGWVLAELCWQICGSKAVTGTYRRLLRLEDRL